MTEAAAGGARRSSWHKLGDGPWEGTVVLVINNAEQEFEVEQLKTGWRSPPGNGSGSDVSVRARQLGELVQQLGGQKPVRRKR